MITMIGQPHLSAISLLLEAVLVFHGVLPLSERGWITKLCLSCKLYYKLSSHMEVCRLFVKVLTKTDTDLEIGRFSGCSSPNISSDTNCFGGKGDE